MAPDFFAQLIAGESAAAALLPVQPLDPAAWDSAVERASRRRPLQGVVEELQRQAECLPRSESRARHLDAFARPGTAVVVTGQQVGTFLGPLYTLHKAATAVARARWLTARTGRAVVPVFWLQTEDHDWAEIGRYDGCVRGRWLSGRLPAESVGEERVSIADRRLPNETAHHVALVARALRPLPHGEEVAALLERHYVPGRPPGAAFAGVLAELFADAGLVLLDPRTLAFARLAAPILRTALERHEELAAALEARCAALTAAGFDEQVHTRADAALAFFHPRGPSGPRYRPERDGGGFRTPDGPIARDELLGRLADDPLSFSTSALLRPLVQDTLLPTAAYLGGPAECTYFAQLPPVYRLFGLELPMVAPRARLRVVDPWTGALLDELGLQAEDAERPLHELAARLHAFPPWMDGSLRERLLAPLERALEALRPDAVALDPRLARNIDKTRAHAARGVDRLLAKLQRTVLTSAGGDGPPGRSVRSLEALDHLAASLHPAGRPQERVHGFWGIAAEVGPGALVSALVDAAAALTPDVRTVRP